MIEPRGPLSSPSQRALLILRRLIAPITEVLTFYYG